LFDVACHEQRSAIAFSDQLSVEPCLS
jgi:hypothetical protein